MHILKKVNHILNRETKIKLIILVIAIIIGAVLETLTVTAVMPLISVMLENELIETNRYVKFAYDFLKLSNVDTFLALIAFLVASIYIIRGIYIFILTRVQTRFIARTQLGLADRLLRKILGYPYLYHTGKNLAELDSIILTDTGHMFSMMTHILTLLADAFMSLFILATLFILSPLITLSILAGVSILVLIYFKIFRKEIDNAGVKRRKSIIGMRKSVNQALGGIKEVKLLRRETFFQNAFKKFSALNVKTNTRFTVLNAVPKLMIESVCFGCAFIAVGFFFFIGTDMTGLLPMFGVFILAAFRIMPAITRTVNNVSVVINFKSSVDAVYNSLFCEEQNAAGMLQPEPAQPQDIRECDITVDNVSFTYPNIDSAVLKNISMIIPEKKSVAFIGPSGAGKTTLADIILGVLNPETGGVFYSGKSIHHNFEWWCGKVGYIPQQIYLLDESVLENVAFGLEREKIDVDRVWHSLEQAQLADFIRSLPDGLNTTIGERGIRLSGGQRQRIGIARALYENPAILVLDEATSSLDTETEQAVMESIEKFQGEKTMIIIAHRLSTIENCDIIYRIENGKAYRER